MASMSGSKVAAWPEEVRERKALSGKPPDGWKLDRVRGRSKGGLRRLGGSQHAGLGSWARDLGGRLLAPLLHQDSVFGGCPAFQVDWGRSVYLEPKPLLRGLGLRSPAPLADPSFHRGNRWWLLRDRR